MRSNILMTGVGGQGTVLASKLMAAAAVERGIPVMSAETIGMAQKGGSVFSFLRMGDELYCPMFPEGTADILIGFEPAEAVRMFPYLKKGGTVIVNTHAIMPVTASLSGSDYTGEKMTDFLKRQDCELILIDGEAACREVGSPKVLNMILLGAAVRSCKLPVSLDDIENAMKKAVRPQFVELNSRALRFQIK